MKLFGLLTLLVSAIIGFGQVVNKDRLNASIATIPLIKTNTIELVDQKNAYSMPSEVQAESLLLYDIAEDEILVQKSTNTFVPIASLSKLTTALLAVEYLPLDSVTTISSEAAERDGSSAYLIAGDRLYIKDLLALMLVGSANDAAKAIADAVGEHLGGNTFEKRQRLFVTLMNDKSAELGMRHTFYQNPTGLDVKAYAPSNYSTASDLVLLIKEISKYPLLWELSRNNEATVISLDHIEHKISNTNIISSDIPHYVGGKTGTTDLAGESLILLHAPAHTRFEDALNFLQHNNIL